MRLNADFDRRAAAHAEQGGWAPSPMPGVERLMLDRIGDEVARATSLVRYAPKSSFSPHVHGGGEEFLVLEGVFQDEHGDYPAGSYVRNPPGSRHTPASAQGCTILVKLWQFDPADRRRIVIDTGEGALRLQEAEPGVAAGVLLDDADEVVRVERWSPGATVRRDLPGGAEIFCLDGDFVEGGESFGRWSWLRLPPGARLEATAGPRGCRVWTKAAHLRNVAAPAVAAS